VAHAVADEARRAGNSRATPPTDLGAPTAIEASALGR
jgi:hypothetical protein